MNCCVMKKSCVTVSEFTHWVVYYVQWDQANFFNYGSNILFLSQVIEII